MVSYRCFQQAGGEDVTIYMPDIFDLWTRGLSIWRGLWKMKHHRKTGLMLKFILYSLGSGESWKSLEHDRSYDWI